MHNKFKTAGISSSTRFHQGNQHVKVKCNRRCKLSGLSAFHPVWRFYNIKQNKSAREWLQMSSLTLPWHSRWLGLATIIISDGYQHTDKCLKYSDIKFFATGVNGGHINLSAAIVIRHMKGLKYDPSRHLNQFAFQDPVTSPLYMMLSYSSSLCASSMMSLLTSSILAISTVSTPKKSSKDGVNNIWQQDSIVYQSR